MQLLRMRTFFQQLSSAWHVFAGKMPPSVRIVNVTPLSPRLVKAASLPLLLYRRPLFASLGKAQSDKRHVLVASMPPPARIISASTSRPLFRFYRRSIFPSMATLPPGQNMKTKL